VIRSVLIDITGLRQVPAALGPHGLGLPREKYTATQDTVCVREELPETVYSTSVYVRQNGEWHSTSYQETPLD
jgi:hypothetical protein